MFQQEKQVLTETWDTKIADNNIVVNLIILIELKINPDF